MSERLLLKWGTLKGWEIESERSRAALEKYLSSGRNSASAMLQMDTSEQKTALLDLINAIDGEIKNDWSGEVMSKDEAKKYILEYRTH